MCVCIYTVHDCSSCARKVIIGTYLRLHTNVNAATQTILQDGIQYTHEGCQHKHTCSNKHSGTYIYVRIKGTFIRPSSKEKIKRE